MTRRRSLPIGVFLPFVVSLLLLILLSVTPVVAAAETDPTSHEYHAADLLDDGSEAIEQGTFTLTLDGTAEAGDTIVIAIEASEREAFDITDVSDETEDVGVRVDSTADAIEIEFEDPGEGGTVTGAEIVVNVSLEATESVASGASEYNATTVAAVEDGAGLGVENESAVEVSVVEAAEIGFTATEIYDKSLDEFWPLPEDDTFVLSFNGEHIKANNTDSINISVNPEIIEGSDAYGISLRDARINYILGENISDVTITTSNDANVIEDGVDQVTLSINTTGDEPKLISDSAIAVDIEVIIRDGEMKRAANRYHNSDFLNIDVEGEDNAELTDNADVFTESPLFVDIYPDEIETFALAGPGDGAEIGIGENRSVGIETAQDRFGNEVRRPEIEATLAGNEEYVHSGIEFDTDDRSGPRLERGGDIEPSVGVFDLTVEVTDIEGPKTHAEGQVTETVEDLAIYPEEVNLTATGPAKDFDAEGGDVEVGIDTGVADEEIDSLDVELRRVDGEGTVTVAEPEGTPTETRLWEGTDYAGDGELRPENTWVIERDLTAGDFEDGVRTYTLAADAVDRYELAVDVMPYEGRLVADETDVNTSTVGAHANETRDTAEIVATGPIDAVADAGVGDDHDFVGVDADPAEEIAVELGTFVDADGNTISRTDETVAVGFGNGTVGGNGSVTADVGPETGSSSTTVSLDPTAIDPADVETGTNATIAVEFANGSQSTATSTTLVHRAVAPDDDGWHAGSVSQPATLYVDADGPRDMVQWNPDTDGYESMAESADDGTIEYHRLDASDLHQGFYFRAADDGARLGYEFVTDEAAVDDAGYSGAVTLEEGWHFAGSNYDAAHEHRELGDDLNWTDHTFEEDSGAFVVLDGSDGTLHDRTGENDVDGASVTVEHDTAYWVRVTESDEAPLTRDVVLSAFDEDGATEDG